MPVFAPLVFFYILFYSFFMGFDEELFIGLSLSFVFFFLYSYLGSTFSFFFFSKIELIYSLFLSLIRLGLLLKKTVSFSISILGLNSRFFTILIFYDFLNNFYLKLKRFNNVYFFTNASYLIQLFITKNLFYSFYKINQFFILPNSTFTLHRKRINSYFFLKRINSFLENSKFF